jgi:hypothetical protein
VFTTDDPIIINGVYPDKNVITYEKTSAPVQKLSYSNIVKADTRSFNTKIGVITNYSTSFIAMLDRFAHDKESAEYKELIQRIKLLRRYIGDSIDSAKGIKMKPFPSNWKNRVQVLESDSDEVKKQKYYHNSLVSNKKPYFMIYIYDKLHADYNSYKAKYNQRCKITAGCSLDVLMKRVPKSQAEKNLVRQYYNYMPVIKNHCISNELCSIIENNDFEVTKVKKSENNERFIHILSDASVVKDNERFNKVYALYKKYSMLIRNIIKISNGSVSMGDMDFFNNFLGESSDINSIKSKMYDAIRHEAEVICVNDRELATYAVEIVYKIHPDKDKSFAWTICSTGLMKNIIANKKDTIEVPIADKDGFEYLGKYYRLKGM